MLKRSQSCSVSKLKLAFLFNYVLNQHTSHTSKNLWIPTIKISGNHFRNAPVCVRLLKLKIVSRGHSSFEPCSDLARTALSLQYFGIFWLPSQHYLATSLCSLFFSLLWILRRNNWVFGANRTFRLLRLKIFILAIYSKNLIARSELYI